MATDSFVSTGAATFSSTATLTVVAPLTSACAAAFSGTAWLYVQNVNGEIGPATVNWFDSPVDP